jgi:uncharacterized SAM-binding protein YcdF (DUF218 family)
MILKRLYRLLLFISCLSIAWLIGLFIFIISMQSEKYDNQKADVLLILTGGSERLNEGFKIFKSTDAKRIIISGVGEGVKKSDFSKYFSSYSVDPKLVILGKTALDTVGNALEANIFMQTNDYKKMLVVTSIYHLPRTKIVFALENPDIDVSYHCVISNNYLSRSWNNIDIIISEYNKTLAYTAIKLNQIFAEYILNQFLKLK